MEEAKNSENIVGKPKKWAEKPEYIKNKTKKRRTINREQKWGPIAQPGMSAALPTFYNKKWERRQLITKIAEAAGNPQQASWGSRIRIRLRKTSNGEHPAGSTTNITKTKITSQEKSVSKTQYIAIQVFSINKLICEKFN